MTSKRLLALDVSTKTGWSLIISHSDGTYELETYGQVPKVPMPEGEYPGVFVDWAYDCYLPIAQIIEETHPDILIVEETSKGSKNALSQKILEFTHYLLASYIKETGIESHYLMTGEWRRATGCSMSLEEKARNKEARTFKKKNKTKVAKDAQGKRIGIIGKKHVSIRRANEIFGSQLKEPLRRKDEDASESLLLAIAGHVKITGVKL